MRPYRWVNKFDYNWLFFNCCFRADLFWNILIRLNVTLSLILFRLSARCEIITVMMVFVYVLFNRASCFSLAHWDGRPVVWLMKFTKYEQTKKTLTMYKVRVTLLYTALGSILFRLVNFSFKESAYRDATAFYESDEKSTKTVASISFFWTLINKLHKRPPNTNHHGPIGLAIGLTDSVQNDLPYFARIW